jgi:hypothetical protein
VFVSFGIMKGEVKSTRFTFVLDSEQTLKNIDHLKMVDYARFKLTNTVGTQILALAKADEWVSPPQRSNKSTNWQTPIPSCCLSSNSKSRTLSCALSTCATPTPSLTSCRTASKSTQSQKMPPLPSPTLSSICVPMTPQLTSFEQCSNFSTQSFLWR